MFRKIKIGDLGIVVTGKTPRTDIPDNYGGDIPFLTPTDLNGEKYVLRTAQRVSKKGALEVKKNILPPLTICFSCIGTIGNVVLTNCETIANQQFNSIILNKSFDPDYIYYVLRLYGKKLRDKIGNNSTVLSIISKSNFVDILISIEDNKDKQIKIGRVLSKIDERISLNKRMIAELEAMAKQLYDYWFVQFDFPDKNGKPYKSSGGKMVYNEIIKRESPEGWDVKLLEEILSLLRDGTHNPPKRVESGIPLLTGTMFGNYFINHSLATYITEVDYNNIHKQYKPQSGDIILTKIGTIGNVNYLRNKDIPLAIHCNSALLRFPSSMGKSFPLFLCKSQLFSLRLKAMKGQSVQEFVSLDKIGSVRMEIPNNELISLFNQKVDKIFDEITNLSEEIESLSHLRDSLLPMLMNGQVTVE